MHTLHAYPMAYMWRSEDNFKELKFLYRVGPGDGTWTTKFRDKYLYLTEPSKCVLRVELY